MSATLTNMVLPNKASFHQVILLDSDGFICDSCESVFDTSDFRDCDLGDHFHFLASEFDNIMSSDADKLTFSQIQTSLACLPGFYDYTFSKKIIKDKIYILWEIFDYTDVYKEYVKVQQIKNELDIQKQFILRQKDLQNRKNAYSSNFFQTNYIEEQKSKNEKLIRKLLQDKFGDPKLMSDNTGESNMDLHFLRGHLEALIKEVDFFLDQTKELTDNEIDVRAFTNSLFNTNDPHTSLKNLFLSFEDTVPEKININKSVLNQILSIMCLDKTELNEKISRTLNFSSIIGPSTLLSLKYVEGAHNEKHIGNCHSKRIIKLSILKSLVSMLEGIITSKYDDNSCGFEVTMTLPYK